MRTIYMNLHLKHSSRITYILYRYIYIHPSFVPVQVIVIAASRFNTFHRLSIFEILALMMSTDAHNLAMNDTWTVGLAKSW